VRRSRSSRTTVVERDVRSILDVDLHEFYKFRSSNRQLKLQALTAQSPHVAIPHSGENGSRFLSAALSAVRGEPGSRRAKGGGLYRDPSERRSWRLSNSPHTTKIPPKPVAEAHWLDIPTFG
jgi:hypothetical protein